MSTKLALLLLLLAGPVEPAPLPIEPAGGGEPPGDVTLLVQSELDYLPAAKRKVTLELERAKPAAALDKIRKAAAGLRIEVRGALPKTPALSGTFRETEVRKVLEWFAERVPVAFKAEPPSTLWVIVQPAREPREE